MKHGVLKVSTTMPVSQDRTSNGLESILLSQFVLNVTLVHLSSVHLELCARNKLLIKYKPANAPPKTEQQQQQKYVSYSWNVSLFQECFVDRHFLLWRK